MSDLTGKTVVLVLPEDAGLGTATFRNGDRGVVLRASANQENGWIVVIHSVAVLFFTDELVEAPAEDEQVPDTFALDVKGDG